MHFFKLCGLLAAAKCALAADAAAWRGQSVYQVITDRFARTDGSTKATCNTGDGLYCGGTWRGLIKHLDYIQGMGFTAVWISPVVENLPQKTKYGYAYHGYWQQNIYALNANFGTAQDLKDLAAALRQRKMLLMVDIVVNHNGWDGSSSSVDYSVFRPFNKASQYHTYCPVNDYNNQTNVEDCWLGDQNVALVDVRTEDDAVAAEYRTWISQLVSNYSIDGLRIDTARHVDMAFWKPFSQAAGVFGTGEVFDGDPKYVCSYQGGLDSVLNYPVWYNLIDAFKSTSGSISKLVSQINSMKSTCKDTTVLGSFSENHDNPRFASLTQDIALAKNIIAFTILADGIPIIYNGQEQHYSGGADPNNREAIWLSGYNTNSELYKHIAALNQLRNHAVYADTGYVTYKSWVIYSDTTTVAMRKGSDGRQIITVLSNKGANGASYTQNIGNTGYTSNQALIEVLSCKNVNADGKGNINVAMGQGAAKVFYPISQVAGSGICGH